MRNTTIKGVAALITGAVALLYCLLIAGSSPASANAGCSKTEATCTVQWYTSLKPGVTVPTGADDVTWPQYLAQHDGQCEVQIDTYRYATPADQATVDALISSGQLNYPGQPGSDSSVVISYVFAPVRGCGVVTTPPTTPPVTTPPVTPPSSTPPVHTTPPVTSSKPPVKHTTPAKHTTHKAVVPVAHTPSKSVTPHKQLAYTGASHTALIGLAGSLSILLGTGLLFAAKRRVV